ncbi:MAG: glycosyltransferase family 2 protein [Chloroflexi bacterium]|jgi:glycosyltransferase involved in cell wall biosynthesis|nr:glycosyltransferase family 2 protein [Chloroflexota bacterium]
MSAQPVITIFTPTYNRANTLVRVFDALCSQTFQKFEWLIIDDGSTDNTAARIQEWQQRAEFPILYYWQENQGKHIAHNHALTKARGKFFLIFDSDDSIVPQALESLLSAWDSIPELERVGFCGTAGLCVDQFGRIVGKSLPQPVVDASSLKMRYAHRVSQEHLNLYVTDILKEFPFPALAVPYLPEGIVLTQIAEKYRIRYLNMPLRVYYVETEYDRIMNINPKLLARSHSYWHQFILNREISWFRYAPFYFVRSSIHYSRFSLHNQQRLKAQFDGLDHGLARLLWLLTFPFGMIVFWKDQLAK